MFTLKIYIKLRIIASGGPQRLIDSVCIMFNHFFIMFYKKKLITHIEHFRLKFTFCLPLTISRTASFNQSGNITQPILLVPKIAAGDLRTYGLSSSYSSILRKE